MSKEDLLLEELSVSRETENASERLKDNILSQYKNNIPLEYSDNLTLYKGGLDFTAFGITFKVTYFIYVVDDVRKLSNIDYQVTSNNIADIENNTLTVSLFVYRGKILPLSEDSLRHEMIHFLQWGKKKTKYKESKSLTDSLYQMSVLVLLGKNEEGNIKKYSECEKIIATLVYYSSSREQDAYVNGYYAEMCKNDEPTKTPDLIVAINNFEYTKERFSDLYGTDEMNNAFLLFKDCGLTQKSFIQMVENATERFYKKKSRVDKLLSMEKEKKESNVRKQVTEESFYDAYVQRIVERVLRSYGIIQENPKKQGNYLFKK